MATLPCSAHLYRQTQANWGSSDRLSSLRTKKFIIANVSIVVDSILQTFDWKGSGVLALGTAGLCDEEITKGSAQSGCFLRRCYRLGMRCPTRPKGLILVTCPLSSVRGHICFGANGALFVSSLTWHAREERLVGKTRTTQSGSPFKV